MKLAGQELMFGQGVPGASEDSEGQQSCHSNWRIQHEEKRK